MNRSDEMMNLVDGVCKELFGITYTECKATGICVTCHKPIGEFRDNLSAKEYKISGMCQDCQDEIFGIKEG